MTMDEKKPRSAERLNEYIRVGSPGIIALIAALAMVLVAVIFWCFTGKLHETAAFTGIVDLNESGEIFVFVNADNYDGKSMMGKSVAIKMSDRSTLTGTVSWVSATPYTQEELSGEFKYSSWEMSNLADGVYSYIIVIDTSKDLADYQGQLVEVSVIMKEVSPISFLLR